MDDFLLTQARQGDGQAFGELTGPYRQELQVHCYRLVGSVAEAEDLVQETLLAAWRGMDRFAGSSSLRTWLYKIATNRCLNALRDHSRRAQEVTATSSNELPETGRLCEVPWLEPYPDAAEGFDAQPGPEALLESREAVSLAFVAAVQTLPPRQRAVLVLRDVLGYRGDEVAGLLDTTSDAVASGLKRARQALSTRQRAPQRPVLPNSVAERRVVDAFVAAFERCDVPAMVELLTDDAIFSMPPLTQEYQGCDAIAGFFTEWGFAHGTRRFRLIPTRANGQPAFARYLRDHHAGIAHAHGITVLTLDGTRIAQLTAFLDTGLFPRFGMPRTLPIESV
ncbi:sigma-70 family RNA polymerase sigma factor [Nocardia sp. NPDC005998]|uniref:sigma-70 family RNA polymerase sigma factor n=1 Tax=Nocardia sp. NPDC005998 TaxID=3156894 RepID=UPI0033A0BA13